MTDEAAEAYADSVLATLNTEQRIAQLLMVPVYSRTDTAGWSEAEIWVRDLGLGGVIVMQGGPEHQRIRVRRMQELAEVPLLVAITFLHLSFFFIIFSRSEVNFPAVETSLLSIHFFIIFVSLLLNEGS